MSDRGRKKKDDGLFDWLKKSIDLLVHNSLSETVILSSYKLHAVLNDTYGVNLRVDRIGRALSKYAKKNKLKRLSTNIPKYKMTKTEYEKTQKDNGDHEKADSNV